MKRDKDTHQIKIEQLERDIRVMEDILSGRLENYTSHPEPVLREAVARYKEQLQMLKQNIVPK